MLITETWLFANKKGFSTSKCNNLVLMWFWKATFAASGL